MTTLQALGGIGRPELARVAEMLESGLLNPPYSELGLKNYVGESQASLLFHFLSELTTQGMTPSQMAVVLRAYLEGNFHAGDQGEDINIVVSGPEPLATFRDTSVVVRQMFSRAQQNVLAVGFAIHQGRSIFQDLANRLDDLDDLEVVICVDIRREIGSTTDIGQILRGYALKFLDAEWPGKRLPRLYYDPRSLVARSGPRSALHAKCVAVDSEEVLVTSANFTEAAQRRNIELGLHLKSSSIARQVEDHFYSLIKNGYLERLPLP